MRIALLSDIHGNDIALQAVLADIDRRGGVDVYWVLGDVAAIGHAPVRTLEILAALPNLVAIRGNTEGYIITGDRPGPTLAEVQEDPTKLALLLDLEGSFSWTQGAVTASGWFDWIASLPLEFRETLPDGTRVLGVHASPGQDAGSGFRLDDEEAQIQALLTDCPEDLVLVGHTHVAFSLRYKDWHIVNPGSVSNPGGTDPRASYAILLADDDGYQVEFHKVAYDVRKVIQVLGEIRHPAREFIIQHLGVVD
jgi:predicted phosphodiesterase